MSAGKGHLSSCERVRKSFGDNLVLDGIDLTIDRGEVVVIAGPSGSGKSTMLRCINGLEGIDEGEVRFDGRSLAKAGKDVNRMRAEIGMVFQQFNLFAHKSVMHNLTMAPIEVKGLAQGRGARARRRLLERVGLDREGGRLPGRPVGRPAAARRDRPGAGHGAEAHALRRAHLGTRPGDDPGGARRHARPRARRHDHGRRHARDGLRARGRATGSSSSTTARSSSRRRRTSSSTRRRASARAIS